MIRNETVICACAAIVLNVSLDLSSDERRQEAIQAGRKRSIKDRLGTRREGGHGGGGGGGGRGPGGHRRRDRRMESGELEEMSIPPPGKPRAIADIDSEVRKCSTTP